MVSGLPDNLTVTSRPPNWYVHRHTITKRQNLSKLQNKDLIQKRDQSCRLPKYHPKFQKTPSFKGANLKTFFLNQNSDN